MFQVCLERKTEACHVAADIRKQGKKILHPLQMFSLLACGAGASLNFNQMSNKAGLVEKKLSLIYGVFCKQESTLSSPSLPAKVFLLHCSERTSPVLSAVKTLSVSLFSFLLKCCNLGVVVPYLSVFFVSLFCLSKSKGNNVLKMRFFSRASDRDL